MEREWRDMRAVVCRGAAAMARLWLGNGQIGKGGRGLQGAAVIGIIHTTDMTEMHRPDQGYVIRRNL